MQVIFCLFLLQAFAQNLPAGHPPIENSDSVGPSEAEKTFIEVDHDQALLELKAIAERLDGPAMAELPIQHNGRIKPLQTLARETLLFISGKYKPFALEPVATFMALPLSPTATSLNVIEIRDPDLREQLGFIKSQRHFSVTALEKSPLLQLAQPIMEKEQRNSRAVSPKEKTVLETYQQLSLAKMVMDGSLFLQTIDFKPLTDKQPSAGDSAIIQAGQSFLKGLAEGQSGREGTDDLRSAIVQQEVPDLLKWQIQTTGREVLLNRAQVFFWTAIALFVLGCLLAVPNLAQFASDRAIASFLMIPIALIAIGLGIRVSITGFAPVTNMYGTMIWVSLGIVTFSTLLFFLYKNRPLTGLLCLASSLVLFLTESVPLVLSPDLDPLVAVLRSNYWLTIHVLTITISYAAFSIAMVIGNVALIRTLLFSADDNKLFFRAYSHYAYRMIQLGVFLLTAGIILGGVWADYSWGRFWGWDPKETWALIADVGFLAILHARYTGWLRDFGTLAASPVAYLLVIMAWYGVNFILAAGLHSYGFSSGGAWAVGIFVSLQLLLLIAALGRHQNVFGGIKRQKTEPK